MDKPEEEEEKEDDKKPENDEEDPPELPPYPFIVVATHSDKKKGAPKAKNVITVEQGQDLAQSFGVPFFEVSDNGKNVENIKMAIVAAIYNVENNIVYDKEPTRWEKCWNGTFCKCITLNHCCGCCNSGCSIM